MEVKDLEFEDWVALSRYDKETKELDFQNALILNTPVTRDHLVGAGLAEKNGSLTQLGLKCAKQICAKEESLQKGVPFAVRKKQDPEAIVSKLPRTTWFESTVLKKQVISNGEILFFGKPAKGMEAVKAEAAPIKKNLKTCSGGGYVEVTPHTYQIVALGQVEFIWLASKGEDLMLPIQTKYFDFVRKRYTSGTFFARSDKEAVQVRVVNQGLKEDVIALIMPVIEIGEKPAKRGDNG